MFPEIYAWEYVLDASKPNYAAYFEIFSGNLYWRLLLLFCLIRMWKRSLLSSVSTRNLSNYVSILIQDYCIFFCSLCSW